MEDVSPADIFISYASEDRDVASRLAADLEARGWSVWWDREIVPGSMFSEVIEEAIAAARCVVVLWSPDAVESHWVQAEASEGLRRGVLVPATITDCVLPLEFRRIEAAQLGRRWRDDDDEFRGLVGAVASRLEQSIPSGVALRRAPTRAGSRRWLAAAAVVAAGVAIGLATLLPEAESGSSTVASPSSSTVASTPATTATPTTAASTTPTSATTVPSDPVEVLAADPITEAGIGSIEMGMRADEIRDVLPQGLVVEVYDQQGPLVDTEGVTIRREEGEPVMYALSLPGEGPGLGILIFVDSAFQTEEGVGPGSTIAEASLPYGFATLSFSYANEGREFVDFEYSPYSDLWFRVESTPGDFAGIYPEPLEESNSTTEFLDGATIASVWVVCRECSGSGG